MSTPDWTDVLPVVPLGGTLCEAWMTCFEPPEAGLLVEHFLPSLIRSFPQDVNERTLFFGALDNALKPLRGRITVISSPHRGEQDRSQYPWLWRYVDHFTVGKDSHAVQHAKLWAFHWKVDNDDFIELYVSSTNLTTSAFKGQIQAGWKATLKLASLPAASALRSWGEFIPFIHALGASAGASASSRVQRLINLLGRVECPAGVTFVASIPGGKSAARQLKKFDVAEIHVMTPTIGDWGNQSLTAWCHDVGVSLNRIHVKWISTNHPWAERAGWTLSTKAHAALNENGVGVECLPSPVCLAESHRDADLRWSHAKLYLLCNGSKHRLLVTSANWSASAWGAGRRTPVNFELGVVFDSGWNHLARICQPFDPPRTAPYCVERADDDEMPSTLEWAQAEWDGECISVQVRSTNAEMPIKADIGFSGGRADQQIILTDRIAKTPWSDAEAPPLVVSLNQGNDILNVNVLDLRQHADFARTPLPEVDIDSSAELREKFLLERYGGPAVDADTISRHAAARRLDVSNLAADYSVEAWTEARKAFHIVDQWRGALEKATADPLLFQTILFDGNQLHALFNKRQGPANMLVAQELGWRLAEEER